MKARCSFCPSDWTVRKDGMIRHHLRRNVNGARLGVQCPGGGEPPMGPQYVRIRPIRWHGEPEGVSHGISAVVFCPGCQGLHRVQFVGEDGSQPKEGAVWSWNGRDDEHFGVEPSILAYSSVHLCAGEHGPVVCEDPEGCGSTGHLILNDDWREVGATKYGHGTPHTREPAFGNCHSFLRDGVWHFLDDSAHVLRGAHPMVPLPDWAVA